MASVAPRTASPGTDAFATRRGSFIVRSDLGYYLRAPDVSSGEDLEVRDLHPACRGKDHYVGDPTGRDLYLIRGDSFCKALDLNSEPPLEGLPLHPSCRGGDHYAFCAGRFWVVFSGRGVVLSVDDLASGASPRETVVAPRLRDGLYYYGADANRLACLKVADPHGLVGHFFSATTGQEESFSLHPAVASFLPGGLALTCGPAFGAWECLKLISNGTDLPMPGSHEISRKVGYAKQAFAQKYPVCGRDGPDSLLISLLQSQFSLPIAYGGLGVRTEQEEWEEVAEEGEPLKVILQPRQKLYWWHYRLGLGKEPLLFCRSLKITRHPSPPTHVPLPPAESLSPD